MEETSKNKKTRHILSALFDVRPVTATGSLDMERIKQVKSVIDLKGIKKDFYKTKERVLDLSKKEIPSINIPKDVVPLDETGIQIGIQTEFSEELTREAILAELAEIEVSDKDLKNVEFAFIEKEVQKKEKSLENVFDFEQFYFPEVASKRYSSPIQTEFKKPFISQKSSIIGFLIAGLLIALTIPGVAWFGQGIIVKDDVLSSSLSAYQNLLAAQESLGQADWQTAEQNFNSAHLNFIEAHQQVKELGRVTLGILEHLPGGSLVSSGRHLVKVGESLAFAGQALSSTVNLFSLNNLLDNLDLPDQSKDNILASKNTSLTDSISLSQDNLAKALIEIQTASRELKQVKVESLPNEIQIGVVSLKEKLPLVEEMLSQVLDYSDAFLKILGHDNPRQYLLIFQNNSEIRATGGFIGTYGLLTLDKGEIKELFVDGIFNADGQLHEKIIPPQPIQKISTAWSMHDANWFPDFPTSAEKIGWFYEKTGGVTTDGVISLTPTVIERLLELTGPIPMPEYEVILDSNNFVELIQYEVEIDYDKVLNKPKKILADFAPKFIEALKNLSFQERQEALDILFNCLTEKHILAYFNNSSLEEIMVKEGWAGELLETDKDYLSVVSSNINGYKTDKMIEETIEHQAEIQEDGSIIDTVTITRQHQGGKSEYDWWNRVNSNYLRVYLPLGSELISAQGQSLEIYQSPVDYQEQNFKKDSLVDSIESKMVIDKKTGTHIFKENYKTVFGNWVYVSPGETVVLTYVYKLPFKINLTKPTDNYSLLVQKQSGSISSKFIHQLKFPADWQVSWKYPNDLNLESGLLNLITNLKTDKFSGVTFEF
ncbi:DUF4012 domain-containing protein [Patescibacteria group bacterium]|nr:DUF4012 domain-containing protein [Patescibacteria group bacterium]